MVNWEELEGISNQEFTVRTEKEEIQSEERKAVQWGTVFFSGSFRILRS